jgi:hypothetical protein
MERVPNWIQIIGPIVGAVIVFLILNTMVEQFNADREELAEQFQIQLTEGDAAIDDSEIDDSEVVTGTEAIDEAAADEAPLTEEIVDPESDPPRGGMSTEGNTAVDIDPESPELPTSDVITETAPLADTGVTTDATTVDANQPVTATETATESVTTE